MNDSAIGSRDLLKDKIQALRSSFSNSKTGTASVLFLKAAYYGLQALALVWILTVELQLRTRNLAVPINYSGDAVYFLMMVKAIVREGWWWHVNSLSAPFGANLAGMPLLGDFDSALIKIIGLFTHKAGLVLNLFWFTTIVLAGASSTWAMRRLGIQRWVAFVLGILYAVNPHIFFRNEAHLMLTHHVIPLVALLAILLCAGQANALRGPFLYFLLVGCFLMGLSYVYFAFFSCFILLVGGAVGYFRTRETRILRLSAIATSVVAVTLALAMIPSALAWRSDAALHKFITFKSPAEADIYGLKIRQLLTPTDRNPDPFLASLAVKEEAAQFPLDGNESTLARLGTVASLGLLSVLAIAVFSTTTQTSLSMNLLRAIGALTLACILLGTVGGFGSIFNLLVDPDVRCYNRISIFIAFLSIAAFGVILTAFLRAAAAFLREHLLNLNVLPTSANVALECTAAIALAGLLWFGVRDQNQSFLLNWMQTGAEAKFHSQSTFVKQMESGLPQNAMVFQLPDIPFSEGPHNLNRMFSNDHAEIFALSDHLRWSWPATSVAATNFAETLKFLGVPDMVDTLRTAGFGGIYVDRFGYTDNAVALAARLTDYLGHSPLQSDNARYAFWPLSGPPNLNVVVHQDYVWGTSLLFTPPANADRYLGAGWSVNGGTEGTRATMYFHTAPPAKDIVMSARIVPALFANIVVRPVKIFVNGTPVGEWQVQKPGWYSVVVPREVARKKVGLSVRFELPNAVSPQSLGVNQDPRVLSIAFEEMILALQ